MHILLSSAWWKGWTYEVMRLPVSYEGVGLTLPNCLKPKIPEITTDLIYYVLASKNNLFF